MNSQYRKNLKAVATACKNYTDTQIVQAKEEIYWHIGEYSVTTSDDNTSASVKTVPSNATRCKIKRVYGNTQKLNPTTASDSTSAMRKTMPSTVYDFDVSKVEGASYKYNQLVLDTLHNYSYSLNQWGSNILSDINIVENHKYLLVYKVSAYTSGSAKICFGNPSDQPNSFTKSIDNTTSLNTVISSIFTANSTITGYKPFLYNFSSTSAVGTIAFVSIYDLTAMGIDTTDVATATTELLKRGIDINQYNEYNAGEIRNFAWTGVKVEGANLYDDNVSDYTKPYDYYICPIDLVVGQTYTLKADLNGTSITGCVVGITPYGERYNQFPSNYKTVLNTSGITSTSTFTVDSSWTSPKLMIYASNTDKIQQLFDNYHITLNVGSTALPYKPYVQPTTIPIDLSTILYNDSPLFEENALKGVGTAKDYITPYKACKVMGMVDLGGLSYAFGETYIYSEGFSKSNAQILAKLPSPFSSISVSVNGNLLITFPSGSFNNVAGAKQALNGVVAVYELATPIEVSINWASTLRGITGYSNGTITLLNTNNMDSANTITYNSIIKENCCAKMVQSRNGSVIKTINFPTQASDGYSAGSVSNVRDFTTNKRIGNVNKENDLSSLNYDFTISSGRNIFRTHLTTIKSVASQSAIINALSSIYNVVSINATWVDKDMSFWETNSDYIAFVNNDYTSVEAFKTAMANEPLYYELADSSKTETDITPLEENIIIVQVGDTLSFYDSEDNLVTVPTDLTYRIEVAN